jgi:hypothetical protein
MASKASKFPKKILVYKEQDGDDELLIACKTERECADINQSRLVGVYELVEVGKVLVNVVQVAA